MLNTKHDKNSSISSCEIAVKPFFNKNSKSKKGHNCAKNILRVTSPIGMSSPFHNEQHV